MPGDEHTVVRRTREVPSASRPVVTPISPSVVYASEDADQLDAQYEGVVEGFSYAREGHPNAAVLADKLVGLEAGAVAGLVTSSGMGAMAAVLMSSLDPGDHVVAGDQLYGRTARLLEVELARFGVEVTFVDAGDRRAIEAAVRPATRLVVAEVVSNPTLRLADVPALAAAARRAGAELVVDNTFATPRGFQPFAHGADVVVHSVTKLLAGHADATLGFVGVREPERLGPLWQAMVTYGMSPSPFDCWLAERGLNTFELRYDRAEANAARLSELLVDAPGVAAVLYPGRADHPDRDLAHSLLAGRNGTMVTFEMAGGRPAVNRLVRALDGIPFAPTLGDVGTSVSHPASSSHRLLDPAHRERLGITEGTVRVSAGIEDFAVIERAFTEALSAAV